MSLGISKFVKNSKEKRDAEDRLRRRDPSKMVVYAETPSGDQSFTGPDDYITEAVKSLNSLKDDVTISGAGGIIVSETGQDIEIDGSAISIDLPDNQAIINQAMYKGLATYDSPAKTNMASLHGTKGSETEFYKESTQADFEPGELTDVEATAAGLELFTGDGFSDYFERANIGSDWEELSGSTGSAVIDDDVLKIEGGASRYWLRTADTFTTTHLKVKGRRTAAASELPIVFNGANAVSTLSGYVLHWAVWSSNDPWQLRRYTNGSSTILASWNTGTADTDWHEIEVTVNTPNDGDIRVYIDDTLRLSANDTTYTSGFVGVGAREGADRPSWFDWVEINGGSGFPHGNRIPLPQDLTPLSTDPGLESKWTSTEPVGTDVGIETAVKGETAYTDENIGTGDGVEDTFYLLAYPAERHSDVVVKVATVPTLEFTRANVNDPSEIIFNAGHIPGVGEAITTTMTGVTRPSETAEVQTLYLGGATGGTFDLGITGDMATLAYDDNAAAIETALEGIYGTGLVTVADDPGAGDFTITFSVRVRASGLTADFTALTGATAPTLTETTAYNAVDWEEQTSETAITNIPAGDLTGQHLWIRQNLSTDDPAVTPTLTELEVYYGTTEYGVFTLDGTVKTL